MNRIKLECRSDRYVGRCFYCKKKGHAVRQCRRMKQCWRCNGDGHTARTCKKPERLGERKPFNGCRKCGDTNHRAKSCELVREAISYGINDTKVYFCKTCSRPGHYARECWLNKPVKLKRIGGKQGKTFANVTNRARKVSSDSNTRSNAGMGGERRVDKSADPARHLKTWDLRGKLESKRRQSASANNDTKAEDASMITAETGMERNGSESAQFEQMQIDALKINTDHGSFGRDLMEEYERFDTASRRSAWIDSINLDSLIYGNDGKRCLHTDDAIPSLETLYGGFPVVMDWESSRNVVHSPASVAMTRKEDDISNHSGNVITTVISKRIDNFRLKPATTCYVRNYTVSYSEESRSHAGSGSNNKMTSRRGSPKQQCYQTITEWSSGRK